MLLWDKYPKLEKYFKSGIKSTSKALSHSILFYGNDLEAQYELAYEIARLLNCKKDGDETCECLDCKWIKEHSHPAILTISPKDNKSGDDDAKTVITVKQSEMIKSELANTSDFHRVFIFCNRGKNDEILGLNPMNFSNIVANSMLKIIEEPPENVTFFFLARAKNDLISTIVSRSQSFFVPSFEVEEKSFENVENIMDKYFEVEKSEIFQLSEEIFAVTKKLTPEKTLDEIENYIYTMLRENCKNKILYRKLMKDINVAEVAKSDILMQMNVQNSIEGMCLKWVENK